MNKPTGAQKREPARVAITERFVESVTEPGLYLDSELKCFRLKVTEAGSKVYLVYGKVKGEKRRDKDGSELPGAPVKVTIGRHGDPVEITIGGETKVLPRTAKRARDEALKISAQMLDGINPNRQRDIEQAEREAAQAAREAEQKVKELTFRVGYNEHLKRGQKPSTVNGYRKVIHAHLQDWLEKPLVDISQADVIERFDKIYRKSPSNAAHAMRLLKAVFNTVKITYGEKAPKLADLNPVKILGHARKDWNDLEPREDYIQDEDLPAFYKAVMGLTSHTARDYLMVCILTGLRMNEVCTLTWTESVDLKKKVLTIKSEQAKNKQRHMLAMSDYLYELFLRRWQSRDSEFVFPGRSKTGRYADPGKSIDQVIAAAQIAPFSSHSLRRTFATAADAVGYDLRSIQRLLNHKPGSVADRHYIQRHAEKTREPMQRINDYLLELMGAKEPKQQETAKVIPLSKTSAK